VVAFFPMNCASCGAPLLQGQTLCDACHGLAAPEPRAEPGIAGFKVAQELGAGRFSQTWLVRDEDKGPLVLKLLRRYAPDSGAVQRFIAEAQRLSKLPGHPSLSRPLAAGVHLVSAFFLVYQYGGETTLADELRQRGRLAPSRALELCAQLCEALAILHLEGLAHLDLKPANVGVVRSAEGIERAVLLDSYTGHLLEHVGLLDGEVLPLSSAAYAAPDAEPGPSSDLYSVGALLFQLVSGRLPVLGTTSEELLKAHREHPPLRLADVGRGAHPELEEILATLLSKNPARRPADALQLALVLRGLVPIVEADTETAEALPRLELAPEPAQMMPRPRSRSRWPGVAVAAAAAAIAVVLLLRGQATQFPGPIVAEATPGLLPPISTQGPQPGTAQLEPPIMPINPAQTPPAAAATAPAGRDEPAQDPALAAQMRPGASRYAKTFERAQKALWTNRPGSAIAILRPLLMLPLTRRDRSRAEHMMGDATAKQGKKAAAARWYSHSLRLTQR
jgi:eukaryotic-like serine/threonine-protein kinase